MAKMLNLDDVAAQEERVLKIKGVEYPMKSMSVQDFIEITREAERMEKEKRELTISEQIEMLLKMVKRSFPTIPEEVANALSLEQLNAIFEFTRAEAEPEEGKAEGN